MSVSRRLRDDAARVATGAVGILQGAGREAEELFRQRLERVLDRMDLVTRDEFDAVKAMALKARQENAALAAELQALKEEQAAKPKQTRTRKKPAAKATAAKATAATATAVKTTAATKRTAKKPTTAKTSGARGSRKKDRD